MSLLSQVLNSLTNLALAVLVARGSTPSEYGVWAIAFAGYVLALQVLRAVVSTPILLADPKDQPTSSLRDSALSTAGGVGIAASVVFVMITPFMGSSGATMVLLFALGLPLLLLLDTVRYLAFRDERGRSAAGVDITWVSLQAVGYATCWIAGFTSGVTMTAVWACSAMLCAVACITKGSVRLRLAGMMEFLRSHSRTSRKLLVESLLGTGVLQLLPSLLAVSAGLAVAGGVRASQTAFGPITFLIMGITPLMTTAAAKRIRSGEAHVWLLWVMAGVTGISAGVAFVLLRFAPGIGTMLVGDSWPLVASILVPAALTAGLRGLFAGVPIIMRARYLLDELVALRIRTALPALVFPVAGALVGDLIGAAWGMTAAMALNGLQSLRTLRLTQGDSD